MKTMKTPAPISFRSAETRQLVELRTEFSVITPIFGGGVQLESDELKRQLKQLDPVTPIRGSSVRGQLRFWWRATTGSAMDSLPAMRDREVDLWGGPSQPGKVSLSLEATDTKVTEYRVFEMKQSQGSGKWNPRALRGMADIAYAAFPLQPKGGQRVQLKPGVAHTIAGRVALRLVGPADSADELRLALDAWLVFGGLGGRTRRGFGSLAATDVIDPAGVLRRVRGVTPLSGVPSLCGARLVTDGAYDDPERAWKSAIRRLRDFRQGQGFARNQGDGNRAGRSRWPEPDQIRRLTKRHDTRHAPTHQVHKFPRARFGMPIIFHFKDPADPDEPTLKPKGKDRLASPLIIRAFKKGRRQFGSLALVLSEPSRDEQHVVLDDKHHSHDVDVQLTPSEARAIEPLRGTPDPLEAFLDFFSHR